MPSRIERHKIVSDEQWHALRRQDVTASVCAALVGWHPRQTLFGLWHRVTGTPLPDEPDNAMMERGRDLEDVVGRRVQKNHPTWRIKKNQHYYRDPDRRLGATPDFHIRTSDGHRGILQAKVVNSPSFARYWDNGASVPKWIVLQTLLECILTRSSFGIIAALVTGDYRHEVR